MKSISNLVDRIIQLRQEKKPPVTLLATCPNSSAVLEAAVKVAAQNNSVMLIAATLNQVDREGGYTGWTQTQLVEQICTFKKKYACHDWLYACLDHGGPWLKDKHTLEGFSYEETMSEVKKSITASLQAGYTLLHIDTTLDRELPPGNRPILEKVIARTLELIEYSEAERKRLGINKIAYEVGTEEVHGGLVSIGRFETFMKSLKHEIETRSLTQAWPCFVVAQVGTDLHTTQFDQIAAKRIYAAVSPLGSLAKGHYTDWVNNPEAYPIAGMGGANVGPEFTAEEFIALENLEKKEAALAHSRRLEGNHSHFTDALTQAVIESGRWKKWLQTDEKDNSFATLQSERRRWLVLTGARYVWNHPEVLSARRTLYMNLKMVMDDPHPYVVDRIAQAIDRYIVAFNLFDSVALFEN